MDIRDSVQLQSLASSARLIYIVIQFVLSNSEGIKETKQSLSSDDLYSIKKGGRIMSEHPNAARLRRGHEAFSSGDMDTLTELIAEDTVWHWPGKSPISGVSKDVQPFSRLSPRLVSYLEARSNWWTLTF